MINRMEASVTYSICTQLDNLGWVVDEKNSRNNVTQQLIILSKHQHNNNNFEKGGTMQMNILYVVKNVGHTFGARQKSIEKNEPHVLSAMSDS